MEIRLERYVRPKNKSISWYVFIWLYYQNIFFFFCPRFVFIRHHIPSACIANTSYRIAHWWRCNCWKKYWVFFFLLYFSFLFKIYLFQLEDNFFTILCWFPPYININQPSVYICPLPGGSVVKYLIANAGDTGLIPVAGKIPWRRKW